mgnify:CR=1 FL=1
MKPATDHPAPRIALALLLLGTVGLTTAQETTEAPAPPVELSADTAEVNDATGVSIYRGNVILTRGRMEIIGAVMTVTTDENRELERIVVEGSPARYTETLPDAPTRQAEAPRMEYYASGPERIILLEGGRLWQGDNEVLGETITHYPAEQRTIAEGGQAEGGRVNVTVYPDSDESP